MKTERVKVWEMAGAATCAHEDAKTEAKGAHEFVNCGCGFHQTWEVIEAEEPWNAAISPHGVWDKYVLIKGGFLMSPLAVQQEFEEIVPVNGTPRIFHVIKTPHRAQNGRVMRIGRSRPRHDRPEASRTSPPADSAGR